MYSILLNKFIKITLFIQVFHISIFLLRVLSNLNVYSTCVCTAVEFANNQNHIWKWTWSYDGIVHVVTEINMHVTGGTSPWSRTMLLINIPGISCHDLFPASFNPCQRLLYVHGQTQIKFYFGRSPADLFSNCALSGGLIWTHTISLLNCSYPLLLFSMRSISINCIF